MNLTLAAYEPPLSQDFLYTADYWECGDRPLARGVRGVAFEKDGLIYIPLITAECEGCGDVGPLSRPALQALPNRGGQQPATVRNVAAPRMEKVP